jgi:plasmid stability protein
MASLTIRQLDEEIKSKLRIQAAKHGHSMEAEARLILASAVAEKNTRTKQGIATSIQQIVKQKGAIELPQINSRKAKPSTRNIDFSDEVYG